MTANAPALRRLRREMEYCRLLLIFCHVLYLAAAFTAFALAFLSIPAGTDTWTPRALAWAAAGGLLSLLYYYSAATAGRSLWPFRALHAWQAQLEHELWQVTQPTDIQSQPWRQN